MLIIFMTLLGMLQPAISMQGQVVLRGAIVDLHGARISPAKVIVHSQSRLIAETVVDKLGEVEFDNLPAGVFSFTFEAPGFQVKTLKNVDARRTRKLRDTTLRVREEPACVLRVQ